MRTCVCRKPSHPVAAGLQPQPFQMDPSSSPDGVHWDPDGTIPVTDRPVAHRVASHPRLTPTYKALRLKPRGRLRETAATLVSPPTTRLARLRLAKGDHLVYAIYGEHATRTSQELALWQRTWPRAGAGCARVWSKLRSQAPS